MYSKLQYISQGKTAEEQFENIARVLEAGGKWIQLRWKNADENQFLQLGIRVKILCKKFDATFIVNDHAKIAAEINADGVHLGLADMNVSEARKIISENKIIGGTANSLEDVLKRVEEKCNYVGLGPFRFTPTKEKLSPVLGINGYEKIMQSLHEKNISIPVYAIGGILPEDVNELMQTGIYGVAVSGSLTNSANKKITIEQFNSFTHEKINHSKQRI